ncbi:MAG: ketosteroid isomerase, partial [Chloroflexi bacterium]|nr:ketosteroid isomerase [Chloroflexota bacterium]
CNVLEVRDGKIYREREYMDMFTMMAQLGVAGIPAAATA